MWAIFLIPVQMEQFPIIQEKVLLMMNHINNTIRPKFKGKTPMNKALKDFNVDALKKLGLTVIPPDDICLRPKLIK